MTELGIGWRPEIARVIDQREDLGFVEILAENFYSVHEKGLLSRARQALAGNAIPQALDKLRLGGCQILIHSVALSLGGANLPDERRLAAIDSLASRLGAPLVSDHLCFVRAGGIESGHLLPVPRTEEALEVVIENVNFAKAKLSVPLALENIATLAEWTTSPMSEAHFLTRVLNQTDTLLLLDIANLYANSLNHRFDAVEFLKCLPLERLAYVHVAGGEQRGKFYYDTHAHKIHPGVLHLLGELACLVRIPRVMLERDDHFPAPAEIHAELDAIADAAETGFRAPLMQTKSPQLCEVA